MVFFLFSRGRSSLAEGEPLVAELGDLFLRPSEYFHQANHRELIPQRFI
jgi:hypothetical protein